MSYQVLARKWRPKNFSELMGQEHVVTVLVNALLQERLHHAYLFTGTRGVGKTTIARIFAKSLNCQKGITAEPCGECDVCLDIDDGRFVDLIEIDAASRTKVDDTREILDNVQYAPSRGRFKVYLIDEVHMLSKSSFNALLKTLEEPPPHVKFILATTDPQKLPITVLSRCLQFHLKALTPLQIETKLAEILSAEQVTVEDGALAILAKAARGSMRDSLSLTDQAIAQGQGHIVSAKLQSMLGGVDQNWIFKILIALIKQDGKGLLEQTKSIASFAPNYHRLLAELLQLLHQVALWQLVPNSIDVDQQRASLLTKFAKAMSPEDVQLYYQIVLNGRKDLPYSYDEQAGFDMVILRLLAFKPASVQQAVQQIEQSTQSINFDDEALSSPLAETEKVTAETVKPTADVEIPKSASDSVASKAKVEPTDAETTRDDSLANNALETKTSPKDVLMTSLAKVSENDTASQNEAKLSDAEQTQKLNDEQQQLESLAQQQFAPLEAYQDEQQFEPVDNGYDDLSAMPPSADEFTPQHVDTQPSSQQHNTGAVQQHTKTADAEPQKGAVTESAVEKVLATRNMLRSRKKLSEGSGKKPETKIEPDTVATSKTEPVKPSPLASVMANAKSSPADNPSATMNASILENQAITKTQSVEPMANEQVTPTPRVPPTMPAAVSEVTVQDTTTPQSLAQTNQAEPSNPLPDVNSIAPFTPEVIDPVTIRDANQIDQWANLIDAMGLGGRVRQLALNANMDAATNNDTLVINLNRQFAHINSSGAQQQIATCYSQLMNQPVNVVINEVEYVENTPFIIQAMINDKRLEYAKQIIHNDDFVQHLQQQFDAFIDENSIIPR